MNERPPLARSLLDEVDALYAELLQAGAQARDVETHPRHRASAVNLAQFLALRSADRRELQGRLAMQGLSSLGRCEPHIQATVAAVRTVLCALDPSRTSTSPLGDCDRTPDGEATIGFHAGEALLAANAAELLGPAAPGRHTRIMVTMPTAAATDAELVDAMVEEGMEVARINCAHDEPDTWRAIAGNVRRAAAAQSRNIVVLMDLAGPKLRTGPVAPGPAVVRIRPRRNRLGEVTEHALVRLVRPGADGRAPCVGAGLPAIPVTGPLIGRLAVGDRIRLVDARGSRRSVRVTEIDDDGPIVATSKTIYLVEGVELVADRGPDEVVGRVGTLPQRRGALVLAVDDEVVLTASLSPAVPVGEGTAARLGCTMPEAIEAIEVGHRVLFDDGRIAGTVIAGDEDGPRIRITAAAPGGSKLRAEKGVNLPDTMVPVDAFTTKDEHDLAVVVEVADAVALSFVRSASDVERFLARLGEAGGATLGLVLKIETTQGFRQLPALLQAAMAHENIGVMIARGDLAVEAGYLRLAEVQEEILWLCEAAHVPVIWATEVLDHLAKTGRPSRSEITDAAMADRAECVMLNKGPHIVQAIEALDDILRRMTTLHSKKSPLLRELRSWSLALGHTG